MMFGFLLDELLGDADLSARETTGSENQNCFNKTSGECDMSLLTMPAWTEFR